MPKPKQKVDPAGGSLGSNVSSQPCLQYLKPFVATVASNHQFYL